MHDTIFANTADTAALSDKAILSDATKTTELDELVSHYARASRSEATHRGYAADIADFKSWGGSIPSNPNEIARYLATRAQVLKPATLRRRLAALAGVHRDAGLKDPTKETLARRVQQGIERTHGIAPRQVQPLLSSDLAKIVETIGSSPSDVRDRALLLTGFWGALRRSELVALNVRDLEETPNGILLTIRCSKTDQARRGRCISLSKRSDGLCPVEALGAWLAIGSANPDQPLFFHVAGGTEKMRVSDRTVARIVKRKASQIGLDPGAFSGHSLRAGFATSAALAGLDATLISLQTGHRSQQMVATYVRAVGPRSLKWTA